jgi:uncharacterized membrane protein
MPARLWRTHEHGARVSAPRVSVPRLLFVALSLVAALAAVAVVAPPAALHAQERSLEITSFDVDLHVEKKATLLVTERITANFIGSWNGIYRAIPVRYRMDNGSDYTINIDVLSAKDELGNALRQELSRDGANIRIKAWIPNAVNATHTLNLTYRVSSALRFFDDHDELYWNVTGNAWDYPIQSVTARVFLPAGASGLRHSVYTGAYGARGADAVVEEAPEFTTFRTTGPLGLHENMTVVQAWNTGVVDRPSALSKAWHFVISNVFLMLPVLVLILMLMLWSRYGRDPAVGTVVTRYEPPSGMSPAFAGTVMDGTTDHRDIAATLVDLAVRGYVVINEFPKSSLFGLSRGRDYSIARVTPAPPGALAAHETLMLEGLFAKNSELVSMDDLENSFYTTLSRMGSVLRKQLIDSGFYHRSPGAVIAFFLLIGIVVGFTIYGVGLALGPRYGFSPESVVLSAWGSFFAIVIVGWVMPRRTLRGIQMVREVRGFEEFLARVEGERMRTVIDRPELFEKYLPYAIAFGVDKQWAEKFDGLTMAPPRWYVGSNHDGFQSRMFASHLRSMTTTATTAFASSPRSSSGSGLSGGGGGGGGGSSGGGFGGGGGGGF